MPTDTSDTDPILVSPAKGADMLGISPWSMFQLIKNGDVRSGKYGNRRLVDVASLRAYANKLVGGDAA